MPTPPLIPPIPVPLVLAQLRRRGLDVSHKRLWEALTSGAVPGTLERGRWLLTPEGVDAAERLFRAVGRRRARRGGAAARAGAGRGSGQQS